MSMLGDQICHDSLTGFNPSMLDDQIRQDSLTDFNPSMLDDQIRQDSLTDFNPFCLSDPPDPFSLDSASVRARVASVAMEEEGTSLTPPVPSGSFPVEDPLQMDSMSISQLVNFLKSAFQMADFQKVEDALLLREASLKAETERILSKERTVKEVELEARIEGLEKDLRVLRSRCADLEERLKNGEEGFSIEKAELEKKLKEARFQDHDCRKVGSDEEIDKYRCRENFEEIMDLSEKKQKANENIATLFELRKDQGIDIWKNKCTELEARISRLEDENQGLRAITKKSAEKANFKAWVSPYMELDSSGNANLPTKDTGNTEMEGVIEISDSDDESHALACGVKQHAKEGADKNELTTGVSSRMMHSVVLQNDSRHTDGVLPIPTPKRKRVPRVVSSDSEMDDDKEDNIPIGKLKLRKVKDVTNENKKPSDTAEDIAPSRRRLVLLRELYSVNKGVSLGNPSTPSAKSSRTSRNMATPSTKLECSETDDEEEEEGNGRKELDDVCSESEGDSLGGFIVSESGSSGNLRSSENSSSKEAESDLDLDNVLADISRQKKTNHWEFEADMLAAFSKDPELCMKAVCALYRQQTSDERSVKETLLANKRGFSKIDASRGSMVAEYLTDGDPHGPLKKSMQDLKNYDPKAIDYCHKLANRYSKQLFAIYQNKEDPFFLPP